MRISGTIFDENMKFLGDANVEVVGENRNTSADGDGYFEIEVNGLNSQLKFTHVAKDYDIIPVSEFLKTGYIQLYEHNIELDNVDVHGNPKPKQSTNYVAWAIGLLLGGYAAKKLFFSKETKTVKV